MWSQNNLAPPPLIGDICTMWRSRDTYVEKYVSNHATSGQTTVHKIWTVTVNERKPLVLLKKKKNVVDTKYSTKQSSIDDYFKNLNLSE